MEKEHYVLKLAWANTLRDFFLKIVNTHTQRLLGWLIWFTICAPTRRSEFSKGQGQQKQTNKQEWKK
jgi:hypothetical protein